MMADFSRMKTEFGARYVRLYGNCDADWHNNAVIEAAAGAGIGVYALIWFGWDDPNAWKWRRDALIKTIKTNPKVTRDRGGREDPRLTLYPFLRHRMSCAMSPSGVNHCLIGHSTLGVSPTPSTRRTSNTSQRSFALAP